MKPKSVTGTGTETEAEVEESPTEIDIPEDDQLRGALNALMTDGDGLSVPRLLELAEVSREADNFESLRRSLHRFLQKEEGSRLHPQLRVRLINLCRERLPNLDILTPAFYVGSEKMCAAMQRAASTFYSVRPDRFEELKKQAQGRFFLYKKPVSPVLSAWIIRSYCRVWAASGFMMVAEYQDGSFRSKDIGSEVVHEFYVGTCTKKDGVLTLMLRHLANGAIKNIYFDNIGFDSTTKLVTGGYGIAVETCEAFTPGRLASSGCVLKRIPDSFTFGAISKLTNIVHRDDVDPVIVSHIFGS